MQTFLPFADFSASARVLDRQRLGKQRVEVLQLLNALKNKGGWGNHPAAKMWAGHENALIWYGRAVCREWINRGYKDTCYDKIMAYYTDNDEIVTPRWVGYAPFHLSHQSNLIRKDPVYYQPKFPGVPNNLPYVWPTP